MQIVFLIVLIGITILLLSPLQKTIDSRITSFKEHSVAVLENKLHRKVTFSSVSPSIFLFLELRDVVLTNPDDNTEQIYIGKIRIHYSIVTLLKGNIANAVKSITLVNSKFSFDKQKNNNLFFLFESLVNNPGTGKTEMTNLSVIGKNITITLSSFDTGITLKHVFFNLKNLNSKMLYSIKGTLYGKVPSLFHSGPVKITKLKTKFKLSGTGSTDFSSFNNRLALKNLQTDLFSLKSLSLQVQKAKNTISIRKIEDSSPLDLEIQYRLDLNRINFSLLSENFTPSTYFSSNINSKKYADYLSSSYTISLRGSYEPDSGNIRYKGTVKVSGSHSALSRGRYSLLAKLHGTATSVHFNYFTFLSSYGSVSYFGDLDFPSLEPEGTLQVRKLTINNYTVTTNILFKRKKSGVMITSEKTSINNLILEHLNGLFTRYSSGIDYSLSVSISDQFHKDNTLSVEGNVQLKPSLSLQMNIQMQNAPLRPLVNLFTSDKQSWTKSLQTLSIKSNTFIDTDFNTFSFSIVKIKISDSKNKNNVIEFSASGNNEGLNITGMQTKWAGENLTGNFNLTRKGENFSFEGNTHLNAYPFNFKFTLNPHGIFGTGDYGFNTAFLFSPSGSNFMLHCENLPLPFRGNVATLTLDTSGYYFNNKKWKILLNTVRIKNLPFPISDNNTDLSGEISNNSAQIHLSQYSDALSDLHGNCYFSYNIQKRTITGSLQVEDKNNKENYKASLTYNNNKLQLSSIITGAPIERFTNTRLSGLVSGSVEVNGKFPYPDIKASLHVQKGLFYSNTFNIDSEFQIADKEIIIKKLNGKYNTNYFHDSLGTLNYKNGKFKLLTAISGDIGGHKVSSNLTLDGQFLVSEKEGAIHIKNLLEKPFSSKLTSRGALVDSRKAVNWDITLKKDVNKTLHFFGGPHDSIAGTMEADGKFNIIAKDGFPIRGIFQGTVDDGKIQAVFKNLEIDLKAINIVKIAGFAFTSGTAYGDVTVTGDANDPDFSGRLEAKGASGKVSYLTDTIMPFNTAILFKGKNMHVQAVELHAGDAVIQTEADFVFTHWIPSGYVIKFRTDGKNSLHVLYKLGSAGLDVDGFAMGTFSLNGDPGHLNISGKLYINNCIIALGQKEKSFKSNVASTTSINIDFTTGRKVEFLWPSTNIPILKAYADTNQKLLVRMDGANDTYSIKGIINVKYGEIYYFQRNFYINTGAIIFNETETSFDPLLDFKAQIREVDSKGEVVNVYMILDKTPLSKFSPRFESDPPLSPVEIMSMLGANVYAQLGGEKIDISSALMLTGDLVSQFSIVRGFEQKIKDIFKLDLFSIRTQVIQNIIVDRLLNESSGTNNSSDLFGKYLDNTTLYLGKYFGNTLFLQTMIQFGTNSPVLTNQSPVESLHVQSKVSLEWKTPLFLLNFSIEPDFLDPVSSLNNTSLGLSWGYSY